MKRTVEIEDSLDEWVQEAIDQVKEELENFLKENKPSSCPCLNNDLDYSGTIHEIIDSAVPIYTQEQDDTYYLYGSELDRAFDNAGIASRDDAGDNYVACAIYCYILEEVNEWYHKEAESIFDEWVESGQNDYDIGDEAVWTHPETEQDHKVEILGFSKTEKDEPVILVSFKDSQGSFEVFPDDLRPLSLAEQLE